MLKTIRIQEPGKPAESINVSQVIDSLTLLVELIDDVGESGDLLELLPQKSEPFIVRTFNRARR